jgi:hypothetical protein
LLNNEVPTVVRIVRISLTSYPTCPEFSDAV